MIVGCNTDPAHFSDDLGAHARNLKAAGFTMVRFPLVYTRVALAMEFCLAVKHESLEPLPVFARESTPAGNTSVENIRWWYDHLPTSHWQIGNEADHLSGSSWTLPEDRFSTLLRNAREALPNAYLIAGGMVSGNPAYLDGVDLSPVDAISVHPYGQRVNHFPQAGWGFGEFSDLVKRYKRFGKPIWITECGGPIQDFRSQEERATYYGKLVEVADWVGCAAVLPFKYEDAGVPGFGIEGTPALAAVSEQIQRLGTISPPPKNSDAGGPMTLEEVAAKHGGLYSPAVVLGGTKAKPTARIGWVNDTKDGFVLEINGEAADAVYSPNS